MEQALEALRKALDLAHRRRRCAKHSLHYPLYPAPRVAVLGLELEGPAGVHCLVDWTPEKLARLRPQALAGWWNDLEEVARRLIGGGLELPDLQFPILVFTHVRSGPLPRRSHELLWEWFQSPTLEQIRGSGGELLAYECAARNGFHLAPGADASDLPLVRSAEPCRCGNPAPLYRAGTAVSATAR